MKTLRSVLFVVAFALLGFSGAAHAMNMNADDHKMMMMHEKMAKIHDRYALHEERQKHGSLSRHWNQERIFSVSPY